MTKLAQLNVGDRVSWRGPGHGLDKNKLGTVVRVGDCDYDRCRHVECVDVLEDKSWRGSAIAMERSTLRRVRKAKVPA